MYLNELKIVNYRSFEQCELEFDPKINCFVGNNGQGKTNLLDSLYYLSMCKSAFNPNDKQVVRHGESFFVLQGDYSRAAVSESIVCGYKVSGGKTIKRNGKPYERLADHVGFLPVVMISPADSALIGESGEERRRYMNSVISQFDKLYLDEVIRYNQLIAQRNSLLKEHARVSFSYDLLEAIDVRLVELARAIFAKRQAFVEDLIPVFRRFYREVSGGHEEVSLGYKSQLRDEDYAQLLRERIAKDRALQYTSTGIHRDDLSLNIGDFPIKREGSQGQQKSYLIALKLAQFEFLSKVSGLKPILLLDDIFDKLDSDRLRRLIRLVAHDGFGQIFITDTDRGHLNRILSQVDSGYRLFNVEKSQVSLIASK